MDDEEKQMLSAAAPKAIKRLIDGLDAIQFVGMEGRPEPHWKERREAALAILDRRYGKPVQAVSGEDGGPLRIGIVILPEERDE